MPTTAPAKKDMMEIFTFLEKVVTPSSGPGPKRSEEIYRTLVVDNEEWCFTGSVRIPYETRLTNPTFEASDAAVYYFTFRRPESTRQISTNDFVEWRDRLYQVAGFAYEFNDEFVVLTVKRIKGSIPRATP